MPPSPQDIRRHAPAGTVAIRVSTRVVVCNPETTSSSQRVAIMYATSCCSGQPRNPGFCPYNSSAVNRENGTSAAIARSSITRACCRLVANPTSSGIPAPPAPVPVIGPGHRQVQPVDQRPTPAGGIGHKHPYLTDVRAPQSAGILSLDPGRGSTL
jgi:hypothetical protein